MSFHFLKNINVTDPFTALLAIALPTLLIVSALKYYFHLPVGNLFTYSVIFAFVAFIFLQAMRETARDAKERAENPEPVKTAREIRAEALRDEKDLITNRNIPFSLVRLFFAVLVFAAGLNILIVNGEIVFGAVLSVLGLGASLLSLIWTAQYFQRLKALRTPPPPSIIKIFPVFDGEDTATIRLCDDGTSRLLFEWFPLDNCHLTEETLTVGMAAAIGVKVLRDDRELYIIMSDAEPVIQAAIAYMKAHR